MNVIETENLVKIYKTRKWKKLIPPRFISEEVRALDGITLKIRSGELFGVLGPNGAGKTTLSMILAGLLYPDDGFAKVLGYDVIKDTRMVQLNVGLVSGGRERQFYYRLTGRENLKFFARLYGLNKKESERRINELLEIMHLSDRADDLVMRYSLGMKQKLAIARALLHDPPVLILDEPTLGLDPVAAKELRHFIKDQLSKLENKTIILTTHYMKEADELCDRIAIINKGKIIALDTPENLKHMVEESTTIIVEIQGEINREISSEIKISEDIIAISSEMANGNGHLLNRLRIITENGDDILPDILDILVKKYGLKVSKVQIVEPTLEDVFIKLTGRGLSDES